MQTDQVIEIAKSYIKEKRPEWQKSFVYPAFASDRGEYWLVSFKLPADRLGGVPVVEINKATKQVTKLYHTQ